VTEKKKKKKKGSLPIITTPVKNKEERGGGKKGITSSPTINAEKCEEGRNSGKKERGKDSLYIVPL